MPCDLRATYRIQLRPGFGFDEAAEIADYLAALGVSHLYASPYLQAAPGSEHGYDVVDHGKLSDDLGGAPAHARMIDALRERGLGQLIDIVPNHMAITGPENPWWWDVLEHGPASRFASFFDVDWDSPEAHLRNLVLLPVLGDHYGRVLEAGEIRLERQAAGFRVRVYDRAFPLSPRTLDEVFRRAAEKATAEPIRRELAALGEGLAAIPEATRTEWESVHRRHLEWERLRGRFALLIDRDPEAAQAIDAAIAEINADVDALDALLERQNYRLAYWRTASRDLGYRRFFDINTLVGLRIEDERAFAAAHALPLRWVLEGSVDGLRIDHVDGLRDPAGYLRRLAQAAPGAWIVVEKILRPGERLRAWPVAGTTGYDFAARVGGLFVDPAGKTGLDRCYAEFAGRRAAWDDLCREKKHLVLRDLLGSDVNRLAELLVRICERHRRHRDYTRHDLHDAVREVLACFPVYRTYVDAAAGTVEEEDVRAVEWAIADAKGRRAELDPALFDFLRDLLLLRIRCALGGELAMRFQQLSGPVMAKGVEDTAFYCFHRLIAQNEVGSDPSVFGTSPERFHAESAEAAERWPRAMLATSTHDTKRSADVRARLFLLSEIPECFGEAVRRWAKHNDAAWQAPGPDRNAEFLLYQTLIGAWPIDVERVTRFMEKACREAKEHTSWTQVDEPYESAVRVFVERILADRVFVRDLESFVAPLVEPGRVNSLAQELVKLTSPGVPDIYQGSELWDLSLVDPDNRRPVDYRLRRRLLAELDAMSVGSILARTEEGLPKLWVHRQALALRRRAPHLFDAHATYRPLVATGPRAAHVVGFARDESAVTIVPRLVLRLAGRWLDTRIELPSGRFGNLLTGDAVLGGSARMEDLLGRFPVALLAREDVAS